MKKLLVTGASGFLGWNLCHVAKANWQVYGTYFTNSVAIDDVNLYKVDLTNFTALKEFFTTIEPDAVIHLAAASKPNFCQNNPELSYKINVTGSVYLAQLCAAANIPLVFTSTDLVFDGKNSFYTEEDTVCPICIYGEHKVLAEQKILEIYPDAAICRMPLMFGVPSPVANSFIQGFIKTLKDEQELNLFIDEFRTPVNATTAAQGLLLALEKRVNGVLHLGGKERISRYNFGLLLAEVLELNQDLIVPGKQADVVIAAPRSPDTSLDSSKAWQLGYQVFSLRDELIAISDSI
ncbi:MAG: NAD(P)-dependent oxidoreductase [Xenococcaceae cyanobacterium MO_188.B19]|nr:NAD(P)-dependent oxidoreductase [Xenococcaceae cyanobacterium MO_188.B19]